VSRYKDQRWSTLIIREVLLLSQRTLYFTTAQMSICFERAYRHPVPLHSRPRQGGKDPTRITPTSDIYANRSPHEVVAPHSTHTFIQGYRSALMFRHLYSVCSEGCVRNGHASLGTELWYSITGHWYGHSYIHSLHSRLRTDNRGQLSHSSHSCISDCSYFSTNASVNAFPLIRKLLVVRLSLLTRTESRLSPNHNLKMSSLLK